MLHELNDAAFFSISNDNSEALTEHDKRRAISKMFFIDDKFLIDYS